MPLQVSAAYKEEGRIERGKRRVNARYSLENVRFASLPSFLSIILALFFFPLSAYLSLSPEIAKWMEVLHFAHFYH